MPTKHLLCNTGKATIADSADVSRIRNEMPRDEDIYELSDFYKVLGDSTRIKILLTLFSSEICVQCLAELLEMNQSAISHQLRVLKQARLVKYRKEGKFKFYSLDDEHVYQVLLLSMSHLKEQMV